MLSQSSQRILIQIQWPKFNINKHTLTTISVSREIDAVTHWKWYTCFHHWTPHGYLRPKLSSSYHAPTSSLKRSKKLFERMTISSTPTIKDGCLMVQGKTISAGIQSSVVVSSVTSTSAFIGAHSTSPSSRHVFDLGVLEDGYKFLCLFVAKIWWMIPRIGRSANEIPLETQMLLLEVEESAPVNENFSDCSRENKFYVLLLPVLDGLFRTSLQGNSSNELQFCVESGDPDVQTTEALEAVFINSGHNPFQLMKDSIKILAKQKGTFNHIENKKMPAHLDWFGWCTWDAFYTQVNPKGIIEGLKSFSEGGCLPKFLIVDDGWQDTVNEFRKEGQPTVEGTQFASRLSDIKENAKFKEFGSDGSSTSFKEFIASIKEKFSLKYVYMWHALAGYWGGLLPSSEALKKYNPRLQYPVQSPGNLGNVRDIAMDSLEKYGVGVIAPEQAGVFYNDLHRYLSSCGVDGVKVDVQNVVATLGSGNGGRVSISRRYYAALEESILKNFKENNIICCMCHNSDSIYSFEKSSTARASEDFMPNEPALQTLHIASVAFNSLLLGEIVVPDWDMFHSKHATAEFHGSARAVGGCPVYVSDKPGKHDFKILRKLVLPDGSILRAKYAGRPTRDCLFEDPVTDGKSLLKIWNLNMLCGVVGVFNCQGSGSWLMKQVDQNSPKAVNISGHVTPQDVEFLEEIAGENWKGDCAVYAFNSGSLSRVELGTKIEVSLDVLKCEIFTVSPVRVFDENIELAPIGLIDMYNSAGALNDVKYDPVKCEVKIVVRGCGCFGTYALTKPKYCKVDLVEEDFIYDAEDKFLKVQLKGECSSREIDIGY